MKTIKSLKTIVELEQTCLSYMKYALLASAISMLLIAIFAILWPIFFQASGFSIVTVTLLSVYLVMTIASSIVINYFNIIFLCKTKSENHLLLEITISFSILIVIASFIVSLLMLTVLSSNIVCFIVAIACIVLILMSLIMQTAASLINYREYKEGTIVFRQSI